MASILTASGTPHTRPTTRLPTCGIVTSAFPPSASSVVARTTSGRWAYPVRAVLPPKSSTTAALSTVLTGVPSEEEKNGLSRSGISSSCRTSRTVPYHVVGELPRKNIDTGMGLERLAMVLQGVDSGFDIDTMRPVRDAGSAHTGVEYGSDPLADVSLRILADHGRTMSVLIADGVVPSNDGRGYVLRRIIRRAVRHAWQLGGSGLVTPGLVDATVEALGDWYTELSDRRDFIVDVVSREEKRFRGTLESGHQLLDSQLDDTGAELSGEVAFKLHDTFGFPIELTREIAAERGTTVDEAGFAAEMDAQRQRAKKNWKGGDAAALGEFYRSVIEDAGPTEFLGYDHDAASGRVLALIVEGVQVESAEEGTEVEVFLDRTPFLRRVRRPGRRRGHHLNGERVGACG
jgi:alanyl-tRNA synthetase